MNIRLLSLIAILALTILLLGTYVISNVLGDKLAEHQEEVRLGIEFNTHATSAWIALDKDLFSKFGIHVKKIVKYRTGIELAAALAHGDVDFAWACLAPVIKMLDKGVKLYIIATAHYYGYGCVGRPGINSVEQLKRIEKVKVAVTGYGTQVHVLALLFMERYGVRGEIVFLKPPSILMAVIKGYVDVACLPEHYLSVAESKGLKVLITAQELWHDMPGSYLVVVDKVLKRNPKLVCMMAKINRLALTYAQRNPYYAAVVDAKALGISFDIALKSLKRLKLTWKINLTEMQKLVDYMYSHGIIKHRLNVANYIVNVSRICGEDL